MAFVQQTFTAGETPTTAKWNQLNSNDDALRDGTGIADGAILSRHIKPTTFQQQTLTYSSFTGTGETTILTVDVTAPANGYAFVTARFGGTSSASGQDIYLSLKVGATKYHETYKRVETTNPMDFTICGRVPVTAGSNTISITANYSSTGHTFDVTDTAKYNSLDGFLVVS